jgi:serine/threonine protein kinase/formylglycine-generating enzyme required for sulfatase activity
MPLDSGTRLGRYEIRTPLGAGGMAEVYLAEDTALGRPVAIKVLPPDTSSDDHARKRLVREARAAAVLDHPHICAVYDAGESDGHRYIAMQYVEGEPLSARLASRALELGEALALATDVADAAAEAHEHGIIHRDIKPSNVIVTPRGRAVVLDFGLAKLARDDEPTRAEAPTESLLSAPGVVLGTLPYMSPEQVRGEALDARSDIFSIGAVLYEMLSGRRPFAESSAAATASAILTSEPAPLARFHSNLPGEVERIVVKALRKDPNDRYQTAKDLLVDLRTARDQLEFERRLERSRPQTGAAAVPGQNDQPGPADVRNPSASSARSRRPLALVAIVLLAAAAAGWWLWHRSRVQWAESQLPRIEELAAARDYFAAYELAEAVEPYLLGDPTLARLTSTISMTVTATSEPAGASVYLKPFAPGPDGALPPRVLAGTTPLTDLRVARGEYVLTLERDGYAPVERTVSGVQMRAGDLLMPPPPVVIDDALVPNDRMPSRMVFVPGGDYRLVAWSRPTDRRVQLDDFFIDKYEVTNREYREFIEAGGYLKREYWRRPFVRDGRALTWEEGIRLLTDRSGLPGPRGWSAQNVPAGQEEHPVTGVTWYEAAAYAAFRGKELPTAFQWEKAARNGTAAAPVNYMPWGVFYPGDPLAHHANFENDGTVPVGTLEFGMSPFGAHDMAGNVQEWTRSETSEGVLATGGAWGEPTYVFAQYAMLPPFYSSSKVGFRCAMTVTGATGDQGAARIEMRQEIPSYTASSPAEFAAWSEHYRYEPTPLDARVDEVVETPSWRREKISFAGAGGRRAIAYLYLPLHVKRPLQVLHFVPAGDVDSGFRSLPASIEDRVAPFVKAGRAVFGVVLEGYIERLLPPGSSRPSPQTVERLDFTARRVIDLRRGIDYLTTRDDLDADRIAFFGPSSGAQLGLILAALEPRYRGVVLVGSGLPEAYRSYFPAANQINFAPHIRGPKLMVQGLYDEDTPLRTAAEPLFRLLTEPKRLITYEGGHVPSVEIMVSTISPWLDGVLGRVQPE